MSTLDSKKIEEGQNEKVVEKHEADVEVITTEAPSAEDLLSLQDLDPALNSKMFLVNNVRAFFITYRNLDSQLECCAGY